MDCTINRPVLVAALADLAGIVTRRTTVPILACVLITARGDRLHLAATDLDVSLTSWCESDVRQEGGIAIQAKKFQEIVRALTSDEVDLVLDEPRVLTIRAGKSRFKIHGMAPDDFPTLPVVDVQADGATEIPFIEFRRMVAKILFAVSAEESRFQLNGALLKLKDGGLEMVATDGHRLALVEGTLEGSADGDAVLVPRKALQEIQRLEGEGKLAYRRGEHHLSFRVARRELICRILEGTFPDYERVIAKDNDKKVVFDRKPFAEAVQRVALLTGDRARAVRLQFTPDQLVISAANPDLGEAVEEVPCTYDGPEFRVGMNPDYLSQFLAAAGTDQVSMETKLRGADDAGQMQFKTVEDAKYLCVIMGMKI